MRRPIVLVISSFVIAVMVLATGVPTAAHVQADVVLDTLPRLEGYNIYFSEIGKEASRFDRTNAGLSRLGGLIELLGAELFTLEWRTGVPADADLVIIPGPIDDLTALHTAWLWAYLQNGGRLLLLAEPNVKALKSNAGLLQLLWDDMGLRARDDVVVTQGEPQMAVPPADSVREGTPTPTPAPAVEVSSLITSLATGTFNAAHPITQGLSGELVFFGARSLEIDEAPAPSQVTALVYSDPSFYGETAFQTYVDTGYAVVDRDADTAPGRLVLAAAMQDTALDTRIVLVGDREFATNGGGLQTSPPYSSSFLYPDNIRFLLNAVAWLLEAETAPQLPTFPTPGPTATPTTTPTPAPPADEGGAS